MGQHDDILTPVYPVDKALAIGVFDLFHIGHLRYLQYVRALTRCLIVGVAPDAVKLETKGTLPIINQEQRMEIVRGLDWVDDVRLLPTSTEKTHESVRWISMWGVNHVVIGNGWQRSSRWERLVPALAECEITVSFAPYTQEVSSTDIIQRILAVHAGG